MRTAVWKRLKTYMFEKEGEGQRGRQPQSLAVQYINRPQYEMPSMW